MERARSTEELARRIALARGEVPAGLLLKNARLVNVLSGEIHPADITVAGGRVIGLHGGPARATLDLGGRYVIPGGDFKPIYREDWVRWQLLDWREAG